MKLRRRAFIKLCGLAALAGLSDKTKAQVAPRTSGTTMARDASESSDNSDAITLFLCGDVMTGRGIDQILPHPNDPVLHEPYARSAMEYVKLAERKNGPIPRPVGFSYIWGDALGELDRMRPDARIINLETAVTSHDEYEAKGINYRMHPDNFQALTAAGIDCCVLANNHVLDWGYAGLQETVDTLHAAGVHTAGAGPNEDDAAAPAVIATRGKGRVLVFSYGATTSGIPRDWAAAANRPGVNLLPDQPAEAIREIATQVQGARRPGDVVVASIHWGENWGYEIPRGQRRFSHALIDEAGVDVIHGHSSHHAKGVEVYRGKPIIYGCGDFLNDYEGIGAYEEFRGDLGLMYFLSVNPASGRLRRLQMTPTRIRRFRVNRAAPEEAQWLAEVLDRESRQLGTRVHLNADHTLTLGWDPSPTA